jgi:hypothetical protein
MADIDISIGGDNKELQKKIAEANKMLEKQAREQERIDARLSRKRARNRLKTIRETRKSEEQSARETERMEDRLSRKRARNRLKDIRQRVRDEKAAQREIERAERLSSERRSRLFKRGLGGAVGIGLAGGAFATVMGRGILQFDERLARSSVQAGKTREEQAALRKKMTDVSIETGASRADLLDSFEAIVDKAGLAYDVAYTNLDKIGKALRGTGADARDFGLLFGAISKIGKDFKMEDNEVFSLMEMLISQGDEGAINLSEMASEAQKIMGVFRGSGMKGMREFAQYMGLVQIAGEYGTKSEAATMAKGMMTQLKKRESVITSKYPSVKISDENGVMLPLDKVLGSLMQATGGNLKKLEALFPERESMTPLFGMANAYREGGGMDLLNRFTQIGLNASTKGAERYNRIDETSGQAFAKLQNLFISLTDSALVPMLTQLGLAIEKLVSDPQRIAELQKTFIGLGELLGKIADLSSSPIINALTGNTKGQIESRRIKAIREGVSSLDSEQKKKFNAMVGGFDITRPFRSRENEIDVQENALKAITGSQTINVNVSGGSSGQSVKVESLINSDTGSKRTTAYTVGGNQWRFGQ